MNKEDILEALIKAKKDWSTPVEDARMNNTDMGLCYYFKMTQNLNGKDIDELEALWKKYASSPKRMLHFYKQGCNPRGRQERLEAIRNIIKELKK